jgi:hypothetical protein
VLPVSLGRHVCLCAHAGAGRASDDRLSMTVQLLEHNNNNAGPAAPGDNVSRREQSLQRAGYNIISDKVAAVKAVSSFSDVQAICGYITPCCSLHMIYGVHIE